MPRIASFVAPMILALSCLAAPVLAQAPAPSPAPRAENPIMARARAAWEALPLAERSAIQDDLVWATPYRGTNHGDFGRLTFNALRMVAPKRPGGEEAVLQPQERAALAAEAAKARAAIGFAMVNETRSGASLGVPRKLLPRHLDIDAGARFESGDRAASLDTFRLSESDRPLAMVYDDLRAPQPSRRVTYSVLRPDFFVIVTETPTQAAYIRGARGLAGPEAQVRGFRLTWPKSQQARYEALAVAVSNSFEPFGAKADAKLASTDVKSDGPAARPAPVPPAAALALALSADRFVAFPPGACDSPRIAGAAARILRRDPDSGLALLEAPGARAQPLKLEPAQAADGQQALLLFAARGGEMGLSVAPGDVKQDGGTAPRLVATLPPQATGALVLSRSGQWLGLTPPGAEAMMAASHRLVTADGVLSFADLQQKLGAVGVLNQPSAGALAAAATPSLQTLHCANEAAAAR